MCVYIYMYICMYVYPEVEEIFQIMGRPNEETWPGLPCPKILRSSGMWCVRMWCLIIIYIYIYMYYQQ